MKGVKYRIDQPSTALSRGSSEETAAHFWKYLGLPSTYSNFIVQWRIAYVPKRLKKLQSAALHAVLWVIRLERNQRTFHDKQSEEDSLWKNIFRLLMFSLCRISNSDVNFDTVGLVLSIVFSSWEEPTHCNILLFNIIPFFYWLKKNGTGKCLSLWWPRHWGLNSRSWVKFFLSLSSLPHWTTK